jgi:GNAT superfamily N-acetyltransferase
MADDTLIAPLSPERLTDFLDFFEGGAFTDNPKWSFCYCQCFHEDHAVVRWVDRTATDNRQAACARVHAGTMQGLLAYRNGQPIGWCSAAPRTMYRALDAEPVPDLPPETVGAILCFLVHPDHRGTGVARQLLDAACRSLKQQGMAVVEANPRPNATSDAENHFGPLSLYLSAGFGVHRHDADGSVFVRKALSGTV